MFYKISFLKKSSLDIILFSDLENNEQTETINLSFIASVSDIQYLKDPAGKKTPYNYSLVTMGNGYMYFISQKSYIETLESLHAYHMTFLNSLSSSNLRVKLHLAGLVYGDKEDAIIIDGFYELLFHAKTQFKSIEDFKTAKNTVIINLNFILSVSPMQSLMVGDKVVVDKDSKFMFSVVTMSNDDKYFIDEKTRSYLLAKLEIQ